MILAHKPALQALAERSAMAGAMDFLDFFLSAPYFGLDVPHATLKALKLLPNEVLTRRAKLPRVLLRQDGSDPDAAVFLFEYALHGVATGCYIPADSDGYRTVLAPASLREGAATEAASYLLKRRAMLLLVSYMQAGAPAAAARSTERSGRTRRMLAHQVREVRRKLALQGSFETTLETVSRNTRHNLRRSIQQVCREYGVQFFPEADMGLPALLELSSKSAYGPPAWAVQERFRAVSELPGGVLAGLQAADGQWLAAVGGHREGDMLCLDWQLNRSGLGSISVATAMRGLLMESEIARGSAWLRFESGTTHPLPHAFLQEQTHDLLFARRILPMALLKWLASGMAEGGPLATVLASDTLIWRS